MAYFTFLSNNFTQNQNNLKMCFVDHTWSCYTFFFKLHKNICQRTSKRFDNLNQLIFITYPAQWWEVPCGWSYRCLRIPGAHSWRRCQVDCPYPFVSVEWTLKHSRQLWKHCTRLCPIPSLRSYLLRPPWQRQEFRLKLANIDTEKNKSNTYNMFSKIHYTVSSWIKNGHEALCGQKKELPMTDDKLFIKIWTTWLGFLKGGSINHFYLPKRTHSQQMFQLHL